MPKVTQEKKISKSTTESVLCWLPLLGLRPALSVVCIPSEIQLEKTNSSLVSGWQLQRASGLGVGARVLFPSQYWDPL